MSHKNKCVLLVNLFTAGNLLAYRDIGKVQSGFLLNSKVLEMYTRTENKHVRRHVLTELGLFDPCFLSGEWWSWTALGGDEESSK